MKKQIFSDRFEGDYLLKNVEDPDNPGDYLFKPNVLETDAAAITIMRIELGDKYFTTSELSSTQDLIDKYNDYKSRYPNFPIIVGNRTIVYNDGGKSFSPDVFLGGDQEWYKYNGHYTANVGGCGPTSAANVLGNLALIDSEIAKKLGYPSWNTSGVATMGEYLKLMEEVYQYVTPSETWTAKEYDASMGKNGGFPPSLGIISKPDYRNAVVKFADSKGFVVTASSFDPKFIPGYDYNGMEKAINEGYTVSFLDGLTPLTMYNIDGSKSSNVLSLHWVNIVGLDGDKILLSSWGQEYYIKKSELIFADREAGLTVDGTSVFYVK